MFELLKLRWGALIEHPIEATRWCFVVVLSDQ